MESKTHPAGLKIQGDRHGYSIDESDWQPLLIDETPIPGYSWIPLAKDEAGAWQSYWMKIDAGARGPLHRHGGTELVMVLDGVFVDGDGTEFLPGHVVTYAAGSRHSTHSTVGCVVLVIEKTGACRL